MIKKVPWLEMARFFLVGSFCFLLGLMIVFVLTERLGLHYLVSLLVGMVFVNFLGWVMNRYWSFRLKIDRTWVEFLRYLSVNLLAFAITLSLVALLVSGFEVNYLLACGLVAAIMALVNFSAHKLWSLRDGE